MTKLYSDLEKETETNTFKNTLVKLLKEQMINICTKTHSKDEAEKSLAISHYISFDYIWVAFELLVQFRNNNPEKMLDAGSGRGVFQFWLATKFDPCKVIALDRRDNHCFNWMLEQKKKLYLNNITPKSGDLKNTGLDSNSFDVIVSTSSFEHNRPEEIQMIFNEMNRLLRKDGHLIFTAVTGLNERVWETGILADPVITIYPIDWWTEIAKTSSFKLLKEVTISEDSVKNSIENFNMDHPIYSNMYVPFGMHLIKY